MGTVVNEHAGVWELPVGWTTTCLGDVVQIKPGFACAKRNLVSPEEGVAHLRPFNVDTKGRVDLSEVYYIPRDYKEGVEDYALKPGHVLFNNTNSVELVGKTALAREPLECAFSNHIYRLKVKPKAEAQLEPAWLALVLRRLWAGGYFEERCNRWIGQAGFNSKMLRDVDIPLPFLEEQRRIVARIEELFARIEEARHLHEGTRTDAQRLMPATLKTVFQMIREQGADLVALGDLCEVEMGQSPPGDSYHNQPQGIPLLNGPTEFGPKHPTPVQWTTQPTKVCREGDLLICVRGATTGRTNWADQSYCIGRGIAALQCANEDTSLDYVAYYIRAQADQILDAGRGSTFPNITKTQLTDWELPLPSFSAQERLVGHLDCMQTQVTALRRSQEAVDAEITALEQSVLSRVFRGEL